GAVTLTAADTVTLADTGAILAGLSGADFGGLAANGVDRLDSTNNVLSLSVAQFQALGAVTLTAADTVTLVDAGTTLAGLSVADIGGLATKGVDRLDSIDNVLTLSVAQYLALGTVTLTAADTVTLADTGATLAGLTAAQITALTGIGIDRIDATDDALTLSRAQFVALGNVTATLDDALTVVGTAADDNFVFTTQTFTNNDSLVGSAGTNDTLTLGGDYSAGVTFGSEALSGIERIVLQPGGDFDVTTVEANVGSGQMLTVAGTTLGTGDSLIFNGSAETDGRFTFRGGAGPNTFTGGNQADTVAAGSGVDTLRYTSAGQSTSTTYDTVGGFDFAQDRLDVAGPVTNTKLASGALSSGATFDSGLAAALAGLGDNEAALFTATGGNLNGSTFVVVDQNGLAGYQAGEDLVLRLTNPTNLGLFQTTDFL
ncbi:M10 family metallopeptidase C-terminal domain-containing protein, partial [Reyranella soli]|uniref:M10 family metallopeptidase C-terminal domain-containing protein n=1 Tax=Reyranella soli TaxID=1230389 RepID=UPI001C3FF0C7